MIPFNVEKHFIISDEVAEPHGIIFSVVWVNHCGINYSLQTSFKNLCTTCDKFLVSSYTRQLLLCWLGEQAAQHSLHKLPFQKHVEEDDTLLLLLTGISSSENNKPKFKRGFGRRTHSLILYTWQASTLMLIQRAFEQQPSG